MPLTPKGNKIITKMKKQYGPTKGKQVYYASVNKGTVKGTEAKSSSGKSSPASTRTRRPVMDA